MRFGPLQDANSKNRAVIDLYSATGIGVRNEVATAASFLVLHLERKNFRMLHVDATASLRRHDSVLGSLAYETRTGSSRAVVLKW